MHILAFFAKNEERIGAWVFFWALYPVESMLVERNDFFYLVERNVLTFSALKIMFAVGLSYLAFTMLRCILKEISSECSLEGLMLNLKLQYFGHLMQRADTFEKTLILGKVEGGRRRGRQRMRWLDCITDSVDMSITEFCLLKFC